MCKFSSIVPTPWYLVLQFISLEVTERTGNGTFCSGKCCFERIILFSRLVEKLASVQTTKLNGKSRSERRKRRENIFGIYSRILFRASSCDSLRRDISIVNYPFLKKKSLFLNYANCESRYRSKCYYIVPHSCYYLSIVWYNNNNFVTNTNVSLLSFVSFVRF